jgi:spore maturation protein CgeB
MNFAFPLLLIGDTNDPGALGSKFLRAAPAAGLDPATDLKFAYSSPAISYSPSMKGFAGRLFYRLADRRSWEWWGFQHILMKVIDDYQPKLVVVTGILPLQINIFKMLHHNGVKIVNYLTDDPWNPIHRRRCFLKNIAHYNHIFSTKAALCTRLKAAGVKSCSWLPFAFDPYLHKPPTRPQKLDLDVVFIGTGALERLPWLNALAELPGLKLCIYGNNWSGIATPGWLVREAVNGDDYCQIIHGSRIVLGLVRRTNGDLSTDRSYEIGAIGGCGLYQDTSEHRALIPDYPEDGFFSNPQQLKERVQLILSDNHLQHELRLIAAKALQKSKHTYSERLRSIISWAETQS